MANVYDYIMSPVITEKATFLSESGKYTFQVLPKANKVLVKKSIEKIFAVKVKSVNILNQSGKVKKFKNILGKRSAVKKAIVTLDSGHSIDLGGAK